jgi:hypothetical protein
MKRRWLVLLAPLTLALHGCGGEVHATPGDRQAPSAEPIASAKPVERGAVGDGDLRIMMSELAAAKACQLVQGQFRPLRAIDRPEVVTGLIWIRKCDVTTVGTQLTFMLSGSGWQWAAQEQHKAGGTFAIRQYVKFGMTAKLPGSVDMAYQPGDHVLSLWFTPAQIPPVTFEPIGSIDVDAKGAWSSVVGALGSLFAKSPAHMANAQAKDQGGHQLQKELSDGLSLTINLCTGLSRFGLGREPKGAMNPSDAGESKRVPIELQPGAVMVFGPQLVGPAGFTAEVSVPTGAVRVELACREQAEALAAAYVEGRPLPEIKTLSAQIVRGNATLRVAKPGCEVSVITQASEPGAVTFDWQRPPSEAADATGGPLISCGRPAK